MQLLILLLSFVLSFSCLAKPVYLLDIRVFQPTTYKTRLVFLFDGVPVTHNIFTLKNPYRLVIDLKNTRLNQKTLPLPPDKSLVKKIRSARRHKKDLRMVLDLKVPVRTKSFLLKPDSLNGYRLVIEVNTLNTKSSSAGNRVLMSAKTKPSSGQRVVTKPNPTKHGKRDVVIAIDAGHGGIDPGATGKRGTKEKNIVLAIAKELATLIAKKRGMRAVLIRNGDYFVKLRKRIELARQYQADLFVSLHADAYPDDTRVQGSSVYMLSPDGANSEMAKWLAEKENAADLIGGVSLSDKDDLLAQVLLDLSIRGTLEASTHVAQSVLKQLKKVGRVHAPEVQRAYFIVLSSPDIPSILVETGFISNPKEEQRLRQPEYRFRIAKAIFEGICEYFANYASWDTSWNTLLVHR
jgi:N-acetylmuramoyl-L-alanine amidase